MYEKEAEQLQTIIDDSERIDVYKRQGGNRMEES